MTQAGARSGRDWPSTGGRRRPREPRPLRLLARIRAGRLQSPQRHPGEHDLRHDGARPAIRVNNWLVLAEAARSGEAVAVLPCYLADPDPALRRLGPPLDEVEADQWLLVHPDLRALPRIRFVMDALARLFQEDRALLEGRSR